MVTKLADNRDPNSLASRMRGKRNQKFSAAIQHLPRPLSILDVGGTQAVWETIGLADQPDVRITLINVEPQKTCYRNIVSIRGDARNMQTFCDGQFDVVYSNSVIEHVGAIDDMRRMATEIMRVGARYYVQTPYLYFPIEPHFVFPLFQFLPVPWRVYLLRHFNLGWVDRSDRTHPEEDVRSIKLLSKTQFRSLFPDAVITTEKFMGLTKSLLAWKM
jgi:hypothetical protein